MKGILASDSNRLTTWWDDWCLSRVLRREAHQAIEGQPLADSPYDRLHHARVLDALGQAEKAEAEFSAAVALRPKDVDVWLTRARVFAKLGKKDRMAADLAKAQRLEAADPRPWVETGRMLAELGETRQADAAFARASALGKGALNPFLEAGWWAVGPYPEQLDLACPPEINPDPSRPVAAVGEKGDLKWQTVSTTPDAGGIEIGSIMGERRNISFYCLAYVHADRDRTASLILRTGEDARLWLNGRLAFAGFAAWKLDGGGQNQVPIALRAGRNTVLVKIKHTTGWAWCECRFHDSPIQRAMDLAYLGLRAEAALAFAEADRRAPLYPVYTWYRANCLLAAGRADEYRRVFAEMVRRYDRPGSEDVPAELALTCMLPPEKSADRDRWIVPLRKWFEREPYPVWFHYRLAAAYFRAGRYAEAETHIREPLYFRPLLASILHQAGKTEEARKSLQEAERQHAGLVKQALMATPYRPVLYWEEELLYQAALQESRRLILGKDPGPSADLAALMRKARERHAELEHVEDHFARLVMIDSDQPRLWVDCGRRLGELGRWDEAAQAFAKATELAPKEPHVWKERPGLRRARQVGRGRGRFRTPPSIPFTCHRCRRIVSVHTARMTCMESMTPSSATRKCMTALPDCVPRTRPCSQSGCATWNAAGCSMKPRPSRPRSSSSSLKTPWPSKFSPCCGSRPVTQRGIVRSPRTCSTGTGTPLIPSRRQRWWTPSSWSRMPSAIGRQSSDGARLRTTAIKRTRRSPGCCSLRSWRITGSGSSSRS